VDRDNDVGSKLGVRTPLTGRDQLVKVATEYALRAPDDADVNALFAAIQIYDSLAASIGRDRVEIALVTGLPEESVASDLKLEAEVDHVLSRVGADTIVLVCDSPTDEKVLPLLQSRVRYVVVRRIIVKQSRGVEESVVLLKYYLKKLIEEPAYRRYALGIPGVLLLLYAVAQWIPMIVLRIVGTAIVALIGLAMLWVAFNLGEVLRKVLRNTFGKYPLTTTVSLFALLILSSTLSAAKAPNPSTPITVLVATVGFAYVVDVIIVLVIIVMVVFILEHFEARGVLYRRLLMMVPAFVPLRWVLTEISRIVLGTGSPILAIAYILLSLYTVLLSSWSMKRIQQILRTS